MFFRTDDRCNLVPFQAPSMEFLQTLRRRRDMQQHAYWPLETRGASGSAYCAGPAYMVVRPLADRLLSQTPRPPVKGDHLWSPRSRVIGKPSRIQVDLIAWPVQCLPPCFRMYWMYCAMLCHGEYETYPTIEAQQLETNSLKPQEQYI